VAQEHLVKDLLVEMVDSHSQEVVVVQVVLDNKQ
jgi:hypothetical protein